MVIMFTSKESNILYCDRKKERSIQIRIYWKDELKQSSRVREPKRTLWPRGSLSWVLW